ncbi:60S ribosomal protein L4, mitochondrial precursor [Cryphonectria parasitica EP155]|uniref:Large ribosomal subunit protein uL4m n=1 Tax=Cryphonectria parasitica (strain ATCC 38755 / EP155) TaxID=660469 RepID=A0A9P4YDN7_CRYP1|nr:60S ribosomal protein L4, mitochondrial precursor [Cryphonectria parasitica EP155]KAF3770937.1 60S ribosomal protein L4, mitochondrial precursor [Cryphonectria parasitica EP155]
MAGKGLRSLTEAMQGLGLSSQSCRSTMLRRLSPIASRTMATTTAPPSLTMPSTDHNSATSAASGFLPFEPLTTVPVTIHSFPSLEPRSLEAYSTKHLYLPLRRDILHLAVTYEGDNTRQGSANSKTRYEVHGSHRKLYRQKGTGRARVGTKQSPLRRGGGKTFGPKPRDFGTDMNRKVYDLAWRTALSYRYRRGELIITEDGMELPLPEDFLALAQAGRLGRELEDGFVLRYLSQMMEGLRWGKQYGRTTFVTTDYRPNLSTSLDVAKAHGRVIHLSDKEDPLDVKNLLETGRIVMERSALREVINRHRSDLVSRIAINGVRDQGPQIGEILLK